MRRPGSSFSGTPVNGTFYALPFLFGTLVSSLVALVICRTAGDWRSHISDGDVSQVSCADRSRFLPNCSLRFRAWFTDCGAIFVLVPLLREHINPFFIAIFNNDMVVKLFGWTHLVGENGLFGGVNLGLGMLAAGVILAIMILPIIASLTREVMTARAA